MYVLGSVDPATAPLMQALARKIPGFVSIPNPPGSGVFTRAGCSNTAEPMPQNYDAAVNMVTGNSYATSTGQLSQPLSAPCTPDAVTVEGP
jgi:hypothetical protein